MATQRFPLRAPAAMYWGILLFGASAVFFAFKLGTDRGLIIDGLIHLGVGGARIFFGVLGVFSVAFVIAAILGIASMRGGRLAVELGEESIHMPGAPLRPWPREFRYEEITSATLRTINKQEFLTLVDARGKSALARSHVGDAAFQTIVSHVGARVPAPRAALPVAKVQN